MAMDTQKKHKSSARPPRFTARRSFRLEPELDDRFKKAATLDGRNLDEALRWAILEYCRYIEDRNKELTGI